MKRTFRKWFLPLMIALIACLAGAFTACKEQGDKTYTITFDVNGGGSLSDKTWKQGTTLSLPTPSAGSSIDMYGYTFTGWFYDEECTLAVEHLALNTVKYRIHAMLKNAELLSKKELLGYISKYGLVF